jgi:predicted dehydrogenase
MSKRRPAVHPRRKFLRDASLGLAAFTIVPRSVLGKGYLAPSDKLNIAGIGAGGKGASDIAEFAKSPKANIVAFADVDDRQIGATVKKFPKAKGYRDFREMLAKEGKNIDAVSVSTPDNTHAVASIAAMQMGKHVYLQKPMTHDIYEARILTEAAKKYRVVTQMGNQGGSGNGVRRTQELIPLIGEVHAVQCWTNRPVWPQGIPTPSGKHDIPKELDWDLWIGPAKMIDFNPAYLPFNWRGWWAFGTGALGDMACHIMDPVFRCLPIDFPTEVEASVATIWREMWNDSQNEDGCPPSSIIHLTYPRKDNGKNISVSWYDGGLLPQRPAELGPDEAFGNWDGGVLFEGSKGKLLWCQPEAPPHQAHVHHRTPEGDASARSRRTLRAVGQRLHRRLRQGRDELPLRIRRSLHREYPHRQPRPQELFHEEPQGQGLGGQVPRPQKAPLGREEHAHHELRARQPIREEGIQAGLEPDALSRTFLRSENSRGRLIRGGLSLLGRRLPWVPKTGDSLV